MKKFFLKGIVYFTFFSIFLTSGYAQYSQVANVCETGTDQPFWGEAIIDGNISDWNLSITYFDNLYQAGKDDGSKPVTAKLYVMHNYVSGMMSVLVLNEPGHTTDMSNGLKEFWVKKLDGTKLVDGSFGSSYFEFVPGGWEAKFYYDLCDCNVIMVHTLLDDDETSANYETEIYIDCALSVDLSYFTADKINNSAVLNWATESESENQGFVLERKSNSEDWYELSSFLTNSNLRGQGSVSYSTEYQFIDDDIFAGNTYDYRLSDIDYNGVVTFHSVRTVTFDSFDQISSINKFSVSPAYPNPFNPLTNVNFSLAKDGLVNVSVYDLSGNKVSTLIDKNHSKGWHTIQWNGTNKSGVAMPAGIYFVSVKSGNSIKTQKLNFIK